MIQDKMEILRSREELIGEKLSTQEGRLELWADMWTPMIRVMDYRAGESAMESAKRQRLQSLAVLEYEWENNRINRDGLYQ